MTHELLAGDLLYQPPSDPGASGTHYRLVFIASHTHIAYVYRLPDPDHIEYKGWPNARPLKSLEHAIEHGDYLVLTDGDPYAGPKAIPDELLKDRHKEIRDRRWNIVAPLITDESGAVYDQDLRWATIRNRAQETRAGHSNVILHLRRCWVHGHTRNAQLPAFDRCGAPGQDRPAADPSSPKPGARRARSEGYGENGIAITKRTADLLVKGGIMYYLNAKATGKGRVNQPQMETTMSYAYEQTLRQWFRTGTDAKGKPILPPKNELPTRDQFEYHFRKHCRQNNIDIFKERQPERDFKRNSRPAVGSERVGVPGPGAVYSVDYTIGDIYLVSQIDRSRVVGRPVVYTVRDVWSGRFIAIYAALTYGWDALRIALKIAFGNKLPLFEELNLDFTATDLSRGVPNLLVGDRGELISKHGDNLPSAINLRLDNTPSYRADLKGLEERGFRVLKDYDLNWLPGAVYRDAKRGGKDYRLDATLTLREFNAYLWKTALHHNNSHRIHDNNQLPRTIPYPDHDPTPNWLWNAGTQIAGNFLTTHAQSIIDASLLRAGIATKQKRCIKHAGLSYAPNELLNDDGTPNYEIDDQMLLNWFIRRTGRPTTRKVNIGFDPMNVSQIWIRLDYGRTIIPCRLALGDECFAGLSLDEVKDARAIRAQGTQSNEDEDLSTRMHHSETIDALVTEARRLTVAAKGEGKADTKNMRHNRSEDMKTFPTGGMRALERGESGKTEITEREAASTQASAQDLLNDDDLNGLLLDEQLKA